MSTPEPPIYVVVCQNDKPHHRYGPDPDGPIVREQYVREATLEKACKRAAAMEMYGACRVGRIAFDFDSHSPANVLAMLDALRQWRAAERDGDAEELANARAARDAVLAAVAA
jgi:hypothetical protein